ncbi:MAG: hypothetical protein AMXMBFR12_02320 [Candidatus Babeliales bacterium]
MKSFYSKYLAAVLLLAGFNAVSVQAHEYYSQDCCRTTCCYECSCNPLYCGAWDLQIHAGVSPIHWSNRGNFSLIQCAGVPAANPINVLFEIPKFSHFYKVPWVVGGQIGYHHSDNVRLYVEFDYVQASRKNDVEVQTVGVAPNTLVFNFDKYRLFEAYVGARYYWDRWCERVAFFLGIKVGLVHYKSTEFSATITPPVPAIQFATDAPLFNNKTRPSGGIDFGFDICFCGCWSLVIQGAVLASCGPQTNNLNLTSGTGCVVNTVIPGVNNLLIGGIGTELRFPVTVGVRYSF